jgi:hypothetical protein
MLASPSNVAWRVLVAAVCLACLSVPCTQAQRHKPAPQNPQYASESLRSPPQLPHLPQFAGKNLKYESGLCYPRLAAGRCYVMRYLSGEKPQVIMDWWENSLVGEGWQLSPGQKSPSAFTARRKAEGLYVTLYVLPSRHRLYRCMFEVKYMETGAPREDEPEAKQKPH